MIRNGSGEPLVLWHGVLGSERMWGRTVPHLAPYFDVIAPTAYGHRGGRPVRQHPVTVKDMVDDAERTLDELGLGTVHLAGNSMGGWISLELARRGRARSVCALSPAGFWEPGPDAGTRSRATARLRRTISDAQRGRRFLPLGAPVPQIRKWAVRGIAVHGDRVPPKEVIGMTDDLLDCPAGDDLLNTTEGLAVLDPLPCPVTIAWCAEDKILPMTRSMPGARERAPQAEFLVIPDVGHVPMCDDPELVAGIIRTSIERARSVAGG